MKLNPIYSKSLIADLRAAVERSQAAQRFDRPTFEAEMTAERQAMRAAMGKDRSAKVSDANLDVLDVTGGPGARERVHARQVAEARARVNDARRTRAEVARLLEGATSAARRVAPAPVEVTKDEADRLTTAERLMLAETRLLNRQLAIEAAERRVSRLTVPADVFGLLQTAEAAGDALLASVAEDALDAALAGPPPAVAGRDPMQGIEAQRSLRAQLEAHREQRIDTATRATLAALETDVAAIDKQLRAAEMLQAVIDETKSVRIIDSVSA
ncbi:MAG: hypothetical protein ABI603_01705 [Acidobacteriota bacterium]